VTTLLEIALRSAREAGAALKQAYARPHEIKSKGLRDIATEADLEAEAISIGVIRDLCPEARFVSEESNQQLTDYGDLPTWYIDPLDGTTNFARGLPGFCVSVAVAVSGVLQAGAVYDPLTDQLFYGERGGGAFLDGKRLHVSARDTLMESIVLADWPREQAAREQSARFLARLAPKVDAVRSRGSAALGICAVAAGWAEAYYQYILGPWDVAAGLLLVQEAGGLVTDLHGRPFALGQPSWLFSNGAVHQAILDMNPFA